MKRFLLLGVGNWELRCGRRLGEWTLVLGTKTRQQSLFVSIAGKRERNALHWRNQDILTGQSEPANMTRNEGSKER